MDNLLEELKKRSIFKVAVAYILVGWILVQVAAAIESLVEMPDWFGALVLALIVIGFPIAMILAWAYEVTPEGIKKTSKKTKSKSKKSPEKSKAFEWTVIIVLVGALGYFIFSSEGPQNIITDRSNLPGIAVIPFENMSGNDENEQFTNGLHDDLLTQLSRIKNLRVISRTSVLEYRGTKKNMTQIGEELGVEAIIEGGVQRMGDRVRINIQLIDAKSDQHVWAETYDRKLTVQSLFDIQSEIAHKIASTLKISLSRNEDKEIFTAPTKNIAAYEAYVKGRELRKKNLSIIPFTSLDEPMHYIIEAISLDPEFAEAWAELGTNRLLQYFNISRNPMDAKIGEAATNRAQKLSPDNAEVHEAVAIYHYVITIDYDKAIDKINQALALKPSDPSILQMSAAINRRAGHFDRAIELFERWTTIEPTNQSPAWQKHGLLLHIRQFDKAEKYNRSFPYNYVKIPYTQGQLAKTEFDRNGEPNPLIDTYVKLFKALKNEPEGRLFTMFNIARDTPAHIFQDLMTYAQNNYPDISNNVMFQTILLFRTGQIEEAKQLALKSIAETEKLITQFPNNSVYYVELAILSALTKDKQLTEKNIKRLQEAIPYEKDRWQAGLFAMRIVISAYAFVGEHEKAIRLLDKYLGLPASDSLARVKLDFMMAGMENWPGYAKLVETHGLLHKDHSNEPMIKFGERFSGFAFKEDEPIE
ncbi:MAG: hypothetical protein OEY19_00210 [Gammaproteobacteria bacterium]|nr:hypothetical protein [Gammaproteobacteria bacterium]MDH5630480.1 hypothetical protein [Gammaproteobacteria bacterium]